MSDEVEELLNGGCQNVCGTPPVEYSGHNFVRWDQCYQMRSGFKSAMSAEFEKRDKAQETRDEKLNERLEKRDEKIDAKLDQVCNKQDKNTWLLMGILASIIGGIILAIITWVLP